MFKKVIVFFGSLLAWNYVLASITVVIFALLSGITPLSGLIVAMMAAAAGLVTSWLAMSTAMRRRLPFWDMFPYAYLAGIIVLIGEVFLVWTLFGNQLGI